jgi:hypothetical protein
VVGARAAQESTQAGQRPVPGSLSPSRPLLPSLLARVLARGEGTPRAGARAQKRGRGVALVEKITGARALINLPEGYLDPRPARAADAAA